MRSKQALKNITASLLQQVIAIVCGFIVPKLIISNFGSNVNGLITSITQFLGYITLLESGIGPVIKSQLYKPLAKKDKKQIENILAASERFFQNIAKIFLVYIFLLIIVYPSIVASQFDKVFTISLLIIIALSTIAEYYFGMTYRLYLQAEQKTYIVSFIQSITTILNAIAVVILIKLGSGILFVKLLSSLIFIMRPILQNWYVKKKFKLDLSKVNKEYKLEQKWDGLAQHIAAVIHNNTDVAILTIFTSVLEVSVYSVYNLVVTGVKKLVQSLTGGIDASFGDMIAKKETETLNKSFSIYEFVYFTLITIVYSCTLILIIPFVSVYTKNILDANYIQPLFATLLVIGDYAHAIRLPYSSITLGAGHFKETKKGAWFEAFINIIVSIVLVFKFGIVGVAIGTAIAMIIRTIEFLYHTSKCILERKQSIGIKRVGICIIETLIICLIANILPIKILNYTDLIFYALWILILSSIVTISINLLYYHKERKNLKAMIRNMILKTKNKNK